MDVAKPYTAFSPGVSGDVISVLAGSSQPRTGREIARRAERSKSGVQAVLDRLVNHGVVDYQRAGEAALYVLNREHLLAPLAEQLAWVRPALFARLREAIHDWELEPVHASVFGSTARGDGDSDSDIDLLIVQPVGIDDENPTWNEQIDDLATSIYRWTGNHSGIAQVPFDNLAELRDRRPPVIGDIERDGIELVGMPIRALFAES